MTRCEKKAQKRAETVAMMGVCAVAGIIFFFGVAFGQALVVAAW